MYLEHKHVFILQENKSTKVNVGEDEGIFVSVFFIKVDRIVIVVEFS